MAAIITPCAPQCIRPSVGTHQDRHASGRGTGKIALRQRKIKHGGGLVVIRDSVLHVVNNADHFIGFRVFDDAPADSSPVAEKRLRGAFI